MNPSLVCSVVKYWNWCLVIYQEYSIHNSRKKKVSYLNSQRNKATIFLCFQQNLLCLLLMQPFSKLLYQSEHSSNTRLMLGLYMILEKWHCIFAMPLSVQLLIRCQGGVYRITSMIGKLKYFNSIFCVKFRFYNFYLGYFNWYLGMLWNCKVLLNIETQFFYWNNKLLIKRNLFQVRWAVCTWNY